MQTGKHRYCLHTISDSEITTIVSKRGSVDLTEIDAKDSDYDLVVITDCVVTKR